MTPMKWTLLAIAVVAALSIGLNSYYRSVQSPEWAEEKKAKAAAMDTGELEEATEAFKFVWEEKVWIVSGKDQDGDDAYVWLTGAPFKLKASEGVTKDGMKRSFLQSVPDAEVRHIALGLVGNQPVWEVFYSRKEPGADNNYYNFYRFQDGAFIVTYTLPS